MICIDKNEACTAGWILTRSAPVWVSAPPRVFLETAPCVVNERSPPLCSTVLTEGRTDSKGRRGSSSSVFWCRRHHHGPWVLAGWQSQPRIRVREVSPDCPPSGPDLPTPSAAFFLVSHLLPKVPGEPSAPWPSPRAQSPWGSKNPWLLLQGFLEELS